MSETPAPFAVQPASPSSPPPRSTRWTARPPPAPLPIWATANAVQMGDHLLTDADQVLTLVGHLLTALRIMRM